MEERETSVHFANRLQGDNHGDIVQAGRDLHWSVENTYRTDEPYDELFQGRGAGRAIMAIGLIIGLAGFAGFMGLIFSGFGTGLEGPTPFDRELFGVPAFAVGFAAFALGGIIASIGSGMSRAARERERNRWR